jgi:fucose permease
MTLANVSPSQISPQGSENEPLLSAAATNFNDAEHRTHIHLRVAAAMYSFLVLGILASTIGVMIPKLQADYELTDIKVSLIFLIFPIGYLSAAALNNSIHLRYGQRGVSLIAPTGHLIFTCVASSHPNFYLLVASYAFAGFGTGLFDGAWCAWAGAMDNANTVSGFLHGSYSVGAALGPFLAGSMLSKGNYPWYYWYYVLVSNLC